VYSINVGEVLRFAQDARVKEQQGFQIAGKAAKHKES
jgi:hypothetical protein